MCIYFSYLCSSVFIHKCWKPLNWQFIYIWVSCREPSKDTAAQTQSFLGPAEIVTQGSNWSKVSRFCWRSFFSCHIFSFFFFFALFIYRQKHTDHSTVKVRCLCPRMESFKSAFSAVAESFTWDRLLFRKTEAGGIKDERQFKITPFTLYLPE